MSPANLTLWGSGTPRAMLAELGLEYEHRPIHSRTGETMTEEFLALNPRHKIPVMQHGSLVLCESAAIITYLSRAFPTPEGFFVPMDHARQAKLDEWCFFIMMELDALSLYVIRRHLDLSDLYGAAPNVVESAKQQFTEQSSALFNTFTGEIEYLMPEGMSTADILLATCIESAIRRGIAFSETLLRYLRRLSRRPAYRAAFQKTFSDRALPEI
jgi:glutathione S-transferase